MSDRDLARATLIARASGSVVSGAEVKRRMGGLSYRQAAERMGVSVRTAKRYAVSGAPREVVERL